ncbi:hypothetical protein [Pseudorhodoferax sp. Leaf267]|uniref:hypothetical protein n=1 Tax=Pseudorhodoferax sp. Leaf267 TaxID=1736316 RepID=UPI0006FD7EBC|nr:hypothetical protein [Pseudorhodoferax sp. Leaf267]KQP23343.1 hypothetical protein ASF43_05635 [Pseudorhodoferax sp. Leaf267]
MTVHSFRSPAHRPSVQTEEERAWVSFYRRARHDPAIAAEVLAQLDLDPETKRVHLALYLTCRESLRLAEARTARDARIGWCARWIVRTLFVDGPGAVRRTLVRAGDTALACLPADAVDAREPAKAKVRRLSADPGMRAAKSSFRAQAADARVTPPEAAPVHTDPAQTTAATVVRAVGGA